MRRVRLMGVIGLAAVALVGVCATRGVKAAAKASPQAAAVNVKRAVLVELFTSEGCSSCPPADDLLRAIDGKVTQDGSLIVGVSEHVTYWDHGGWKDPYDADVFTARQEMYANRFNLDSVYKPQMVVNGGTQFVGSDRGALVSAVRKAEGEASGTVRIVSAKQDGDFVNAVVSLSGEVPKSGAETIAVVAEDETTAHVLRGENAGKSLSHAAVARTFVKLAKVRTADEGTIRVKLPEGAQGIRRHLIVWVQEPDAGHVLGVDSRAF
jgi:hypothetical protein